MNPVAARLDRLSPERQALVARLLAQDAASRRVSPFVAPRNDAEAALAAVWREVLRVEASIHDNYFELGGDSILAVSLLAKARAAGLPLTIAQLFRTPTIAELAAAATAASPAPDAPPTDADAYPLTPLQQGLLFHTLQAPAAGEYISQFCCRLTGRLDVAAFQEAWNAAIARHAVLRTAFEYDGRAQPQQRVRPHARVPLVSLDWSAFTAERAQALLSSLVDADRLQPFDLHEPPLMRVTLVRLTPDTHACVWTHHHLLLDGWSQHLVLADVFGAYAGALAGRAFAPAPPPPFSAYVRWLEQRDRREAEPFWGRYLAGAPPVRREERAGTEPPVSRPVESRPIQIGPEDTAALAASARARQVPPSTLIYAAWALASAQLSGADDVVFGVTASVRPPDLSGSDRLVGLCINTVPLRVRLPRGVTAGEWLQMLHREQGEWHQYADTPLPEIVRWTGTPGQPVFDTLLVFENVPAVFVQPPEGAGLALDDIRFSVREGYPLVVVFMPGPSLRIELKYARDRYDAQEIDALAQVVTRALGAVIGADPDGPLAAVQAALAAATAADRAAAESSRRASDVDRLRNRGLSRGARRAIVVADDDLVTVAPVAGGAAFPAAIAPKTGPLDLVAWARGHAGRIDGLLRDRGAVLFRGFHATAAGHLPALLQIVSGDPMPYVERSSPRREVGPHVYTSTEYAADQIIPPHNENSYAHTWPLHIAFLCETPPASGGETPLSDVRDVLRRLPAEIVERFRASGVLYVRNYHRDVGLSWQEVFGTASRAEVERRCGEAGYAAEWQPEDGLRTRRVGPAVVRHPRTGETVWFNHVAFFHVSSLDARTREALIEQYGEAALPHQTYYGDGTPIEPDVLAAIRSAYAESTVRFPWQRGDLLLVDNMLVAHGRAPFSGPRRILVAMAHPVTAAQVDAA